MLDYWSSKDIRYNNRHQKESNILNFVFLVPVESLAACDSFYGLDYSMDNKFSTKEELKQFMPPKITSDFEKQEDYDVDLDINSSEFKFMNYDIDRELKEKKDFDYVPYELFKIIKRLIPRTEEVKRVVYRKDGDFNIKVERNLVVMPIVIIVDEWVRTGEIKARSLMKFVRLVPLSRFLNWNSISKLLKEFARTELEISEAECDHCMLRFIQDGISFDKVEFFNQAKLILSGKSQAKNLKFKEITEEMFQNANAFLFHMRSVGSPKVIFNSKKKASEPLALEDGDGNDYSTQSEYGKNRRGGLYGSSAGYSGYSKPNRYGMSYSEDYENSITRNVRPSELNRGKIGFKNIGNTCYMNSAMQCLIHVDFLKNFLIENRFQNMINDDNPIGAKGDMIKTLAALFKEYWTCEERYVAPYNFKRCVSKYMPAFEGYNHHDSQEFLSQLLDICHEDTNQILKKPYIDTPTLQPGEKSDNELARESWILHLKRNQSFFVHNFFGQFRSEIQCPICSSTFLKYDCYQVISLPVPTKVSDSIEFFVIQNEQRDKKALRDHVKVKSYNNFRDLTLKDLRLYVKTIDKVVKENSLLRIGFMGFGKTSVLLYDHMSMAEIISMNDQRHLPKMFMLDLVDADQQILLGNIERINSEDISKDETLKSEDIRSEKEIQINYSDEEYLRSRKGLVLSLFSASVDYYDEESPLYSKLRDYRYSYNKLGEFPVFSKMFYVTKDHRIIDIYWRIFQKFSFKAEYPDELQEGKTERELFVKLMEEEDMFFYIRINEVYFGKEQWSKKISEFEELYTKEHRENILNLRIYFRDGERRKTLGKNNLAKVDLDYFTTCTSNYDLSFELESDSYSQDSGKNYTLEALLKNFSQPETLDKENMYRCSKCKDEVKAQIKMEIQKVPRVLVIFFKKIKKGYNSDSPDISYPTELNMREFVNDNTPMEAYNVDPQEFLDEKNLELHSKRQTDTSKKIEPESSDSDSDDSTVNQLKIEENSDLFSKNAIKEEQASLNGIETNPLADIYLPDSKIKTDLNYELFGVVNHFGSQNFGHYTSVVKVDDENWVEFNDDRCSSASMRDVVNGNAYMLFYMRKDL